MKIASISQAKNNLSAFLDLVRQGETVVITDRNRPLARLEPIQQYRGSDSDGLLSELHRLGIVRAAKRNGVVKEILAIRPPQSDEGSASIVDILLSEREAGR
jgi:prevent-host-death family protein